MKTPILTITPEELLSISPDVRAKYREAVTPRRVSNEPVATATIEEIPDEEYVQPVNQVSCSGVEIRPGAEVLADPYETYLRQCPEGTHPVELTVARESNAIRTIHALVDNKEVVECIVDPGCQIIAMSEEVCHALKIIYDPTITLRMQSANGEIDKSLGLVRNIPFQIGDITLYMQAHVIRNAAYDILLGRPFDVLTESTVRNYKNEEQTITIVCPNSGETATIPTYPRGRRRYHSPPPGHPPQQAGFLASRN